MPPELPEEEEEEETASVMPPSPQEEPAEEVEEAVLEECFQLGVLTGGSLMNLKNAGEFGNIATTASDCQKECLVRRRYPILFFLFFGSLFSRRTTRLAPTSPGVP